MTVQPLLVEVTIPPSRGRFLTDHDTVFTKVVDFEPREEWRGAWHALANRIPTPAVLSEPIRRDENWTLSFVYEPITAIGYTRKEQRHAARLLTTVWDTSPPASVRPMDWNLYEDRACLNANRRGHPAARDRLQHLVVETQAAVQAHADTSAPLRRVWIHGDSHARNMGRRGDGSFILLDWEHHGLGQRESDAAKYLQAALTEPAPGQRRVVPRAFIDTMSDAGLDMTALWLILGTRAIGAAAYLHGSGHDTTFPDWSTANLTLAERCLHGRAWDLDDWA